MDMQILTLHCLYHVTSLLHLHPDPEEGHDGVPDLCRESGPVRDSLQEVFEVLRIEAVPLAEIGQFAHQLLLHLPVEAAAENHLIDRLPEAGLPQKPKAANTKTNLKIGRILTLLSR